MRLSTCSPLYLQYGPRSWMISVDPLPLSPYLFLAYSFFYSSIAWCVRSLSVEVPSSYTLDTLESSLET